MIARSVASPDHVRSGSRTRLGKHFIANGRQYVCRPKIIDHHISTHLFGSEWVSVSMRREVYSTIWIDMCIDTLMDELYYIKRET